MPTATPATSVEQDAAAIKSVLDTMSTAHHTKNPHAFAAVFAADATIYNLAPPLVHRGVDVAEKQAWFDTWEGPVVIEPKDFQITVAGDTAFAHGYMGMAGKKKESDHPIAFWMRETLCLKRQGEQWKIVHEHTSVPFYMDETLRPAFDLQP
jgi:uncharacterized protein (TIGR02246 family)